MCLRYFDSFGFFVLIVLIFLLTSPSYSQGKYPADAWEVWRDPVRISRFVVTNDNVFVTAENGIWVWNRYKEHWEPPFTIVPGFSEAYDLKNIRNLQWNPDQSLVVTTEKDMFTRDGSWHYWTKRPLFDALPPDSTKTRNIDCTHPDQQLHGDDLSSWISPQDWNAYHDGRLIYTDDITLRTTNTMIDDKNMLWSIVNGAGIIRGNGYTKKWQFERLGPSERTLRCMAKDSTGWVVGGTHTGVSFFDEPNRTWSWSIQYGKRFQLGSRAIRDIAKNGDKYYLATDIGVIVGAASDTYWKLCDGFRSIHIYSVCNIGSNVAVGTDRGVELLSSDGGITPLYNELKHPLVANQIAADGDTLFCSTTLGILKINTKTGTYTFLDGPPGIASDDWATIEFTPSEIWVGGRDGVAALDRRSLKWYSWSSGTYFNSGWSLTIAPTDTTVWVGGTEGLFRIDRDSLGRLDNDPASKLSPRVHRYTLSDGLPALQINQVLLDGSRLVMVTEAGFCIFRYLHEGRTLE